VVGITPVGRGSRFGRGKRLAQGWIPSVGKQEIPEGVDWNGMPPGFRCANDANGGNDTAIPPENAKYIGHPPLYNTNSNVQLQTGNLRTVIAVYYPPNSPLTATGSLGEEVKPWTQTEVQTHFVNDINKALADVTYGSVQLVGANGSNVDFVWIGELPSVNCGTTGLTTCNCGGPNNIHTLVKNWFNNNGYTDANYELKYALGVGCSHNGWTGPGTGSYGSASLDPLVFLDFYTEIFRNSVTAPPYQPDDTGYIALAESVLTSGYLRQVSLHEILHSVGYAHNGRYSNGGGPYPCIETFRANGPIFPCTEMKGGYGGIDMWDTMAWDTSYFTNNFNVWREPHPSAHAKNMIGRIPDQMWGVGSQGPAHLTDTNAVTLSGLGTGVIWTGDLYAQDRVYEDALTQDILNTGKPMLIKVRRDIDLSQIQPCDDMASVGDPKERYLGISYRKNTSYKGPRAQPNGGTVGGQVYPDDWHMNGTLMIDWGPMRQVEGYGCGSTAYGPITLYGLDTSVTYPAGGPGEQKVFEAYTANGITYPKLTIRIIEAADGPGNQGPEKIKLEIVQG